MATPDAVRRSLARLLAAVAGTLPLVGVAAGHVDYVTPGGDPVAAAAFLLRTVTDPLNALLLGAGGAVAVGTPLAYLRLRPLARDVATLRGALADYRDLLPWLLRLAVGLPLVGAGFSGYLFSPAVVPADPALARAFGVTAGFLLLFGLATRATAVAGLLAYLGVLAADPRALLAVEYVPGLLSVALLGGGRPSADQVIARLAADPRTRYSSVDPLYRRLAVPAAERVDPYRRFVPTVLRVGLGAAFLYLGVTQKLLAPGPALAVVEKYALTSVVPVSPALWVVGAGLAEAAVGLALLAGAFTRGAAGVAFLLFTATLFGLADDPVLAHVSLFGLVSALVITGGGPLSADRYIGDAAPDPATD